MFQIECLPARYGDSLWIEYGKRSNPHRILIDGGLASTYDILRARMDLLFQGQRHFDLMVVTHIDADHIEGLIPLLADKYLRFSTDDFWFNGWKHISKNPNTLGAIHGEFLSTLIEERHFFWNQRFRGDAVVVIDEPPEKTLDGGMKITLLSPRLDALRKLKPIWKREVEKVGIEPGNLPAARARLYETPRLLPKNILGETGTGLEELARQENKSDRSVANASSIAFLAEHEGKSCLFAGDAHPTVLVESIKKLLKRRNQDRLSLDAFKVAHHGGSKNLSSELLTLLDCKHFLFSTNGERFGHPHKETIAKILIQNLSSPNLCFNYRSPANNAWDDQKIKEAHCYTTTYPEEKIIIEL
jgi:beta-lactamase superfamily II metal-dependent hydrolase